eukprot:TRINITY_DN73348_c0_g1_i1.p2 TRINITY_DN73348_c0_g1~~TRINITY_DN73348_c0_g1_i1.p2  ORF type:complete len:141 (+),score=24.23 TRINITY_DN73348_c0_g1_i1:33-425(+)
MSIVDPVVQAGDLDALYLSGGVEGVDDLLTFLNHVETKTPDNLAQKSASSNLNQEEEGQDEDGWEELIEGLLDPTDMPLTEVQIKSQPDLSQYKCFGSSCLSEEVLQFGSNWGDVTQVKKDILVGIKLQL